MSLRRKPVAAIGMRRSSRAAAAAGDRRRRDSQRRDFVLGQHWDGVEVRRNRENLAALRGFETQLRDHIGAIPAPNELDDSGMPLYEAMRRQERTAGVGVLHDARQIVVALWGQIEEDPHLPALPDINLPDQGDMAAIEAQRTALEAALGATLARCISLMQYTESLLPSDNWDLQG